MIWHFVYGFSLYMYTELLIMFHNFIRKARQVASDQVLRQWLVRRMTMRSKGPLAFTAHCPPYLNKNYLIDTRIGNLDRGFQTLTALEPKQDIELPLPGLNLLLKPGEDQVVFQRSYDDIETLLALHRFAWLPLCGYSSKSCDWAQSLWNVWRELFGDTDEGWAWHPYTTAERAINILDLSAAHGLPGPKEDTLAILARHAEVIFRQLEYYGDHNTSNHLSNNGRGLYRLGLELNMDWATEVGASILENEAKRILWNSGVLREGSSHYHLLIARNFTDAWLAARRHSRVEEPTLKDIASRALAIVPSLLLPGGMPLIGDISPDCPPEYLLGLTGTETGWVADLSDDDKHAVLTLINDAPPIDIKQLEDDGWHSLSCGPWSGLWHCAPKGWVEAPGHGHHDTGGFELHFNDVPILVDPGRGVYGETGSAIQYSSADVHNTITVSGHGPYPTNKPYYDDAFRTSIAGRPPKINSSDNKVRLVHNGFQRLAGVGAHSREWQFTEKDMRLSDNINGMGVQSIQRRFMTPLNAIMVKGGVVLSHYGKNGKKSFLLSAPNAETVISKTTLWQAYGKARDGFSISFSAETSLPWSGEIKLEVI